MATNDAFPTWVEVVSTGATASGGTGRTPSAAPLATLSGILGWRVDRKNADGIKRALADRFPITVVDGKNVVEVKEGAYFEVAQAGTFALTGAQRSIRDRVKTIAGQVRPIVESLKPLTPAPDAENIEAIKALIGPELDEIVEQLGAEGGPLVTRVDHLLDLLIEYDPDAFAPHSDINTVTGHLGDLRLALGIEDTHVNTVDEELTLTEYTTLVNYVDMIAAIWDSNRGSFASSSTSVFLGTQAVQIQRSLTCVIESVGEVERALESVLIGPAEQATLDLDVASYDGTLTELLDWIEQTASNGYEVISTSGKYGVTEALAPTLQNLAGIVAEVNTAILGDANKSTGRVFPRALSHDRVTNALDSLASNLKNAGDYAGDVGAPIIDAVFSPRLEIKQQDAAPPPPPPPSRRKPPASPTTDTE